MEYKFMEIFVSVVPAIVSKVNEHKRVEFDERKTNKHAIEFRRTLLSMDPEI